MSEERKRRRRSIEELLPVHFNPDTGQIGPSLGQFQPQDKQRAIGTVESQGYTIEGQVTGWPPYEHLIKIRDRGHDNWRWFLAKIDPGTVGLPPTTAEFEARAQRFAE
jgi:hypothetical protein